jgi:three-Cys-motif partner protein
MSFLVNMLNLKDMKKLMNNSKKNKNMSKKKQNVKKSNILYLHSQAKVEFYNQYLKRYLRVLYLSPYIDKICIYDVFCGTGLYDDNKKGSPIVAYDSILELFKEYKDDKTKILLAVNDFNEDKTDVINNYINSNHIANFDYLQTNHNVDELFPLIIDYINKGSKKTRNLIFIDPYGYKSIKREILEKLMQNGKTEIILFLPIAQMQRFTLKAISSEEKAYTPLKEFVTTFFPSNHVIKTQTIKAIKYIEYIKDALKLNKYYTTSYYIERDKTNYYALFFMSNNIYGFEKILEVKWELGNGFSLPKPPTLFDNEFKEEDEENYINTFKEKLLNFLKSKPRNNNELYKFTLDNEFLPKHLALLLNDLLKNSIITVFKDNSTNNKVTINMFSYTNYKNNSELCIIKIK